MQTHVDSLSWCSSLPALFPDIAPDMACPQHVVELRHHDDHRTPSRKEPSLSQNLAWPIWSLHFDPRWFPGMYAAQCSIHDVIQLSASAAGKRTRKPNILPWKDSNIYSSSPREGGGGGLLTATFPEAR